MARTVCPGNQTFSREISKIFKLGIDKSSPSLPTKAFNSYLDGKCLALMPKIINPEERKDHDLTVVYSALDAEDCIYLSLSFFRKQGSTMLPIVVESLVAFIDEKYRLLDQKHGLNLIQIKEKEKI